LCKVRDSSESKKIPTPLIDSCGIVV
jgi:hypothetical protein